MILILTTEKHRYTHTSLGSESDVDAKVMSYGQLQQHSTKLPQATYIFTDLDRLNQSQHYQVAIYYRKLKALGQKVINDPARVLSRFGLLRALNRAGINAFDAYRAEDFDRPKRWPVFLRIEGNHASPASGLLGSQAELDAALEQCIDAGMPRAGLLIVEYCAEPLGPGLFRKLSVFRVGDRLLGYTCVHDDQWIVKYGKPAIATPEHYDDEYRFVAEDTFAEAMRPVFDIAGVEYGRVDFGLVDGRPQVYEINTNPDLKLRPVGSPVARRNESNGLFREKYLAALRAIDTGGLGQPPLEVILSAAG